MSMLHTVNKSPFDRNTLDACLRLAKPGSAVLLIEDGVYAATKGTNASEK
ncbi:MAG: sulfurtransferase complex subunit TusB, partial [Chromatiales bacterium]